MNASRLFSFVVDERILQAGLGRRLGLHSVKLMNIEKNLKGTIKAQ
jgi:hypothetical protein